MKGRRIALRLVAVLVLLATLPSAHAAAGSVRVRVLRLGGVPASWQARRLAVRVSIGSRELYTTPAKPGTDASWDKGLRAYTASTNPLRFQVLAADGAGDARAKPAPSDPAPSRKARRDAPRESADEILSAGLDDLVADYGEGTLDEGSDAPAPPRDREPARDPQDASPAPVGGVLCTASLAWPPAPGEHALPCGKATLYVRIH
jgi:hypothetical protein